jgi:hypothetical protein
MFIRGVGVVWAVQIPPPFTPAKNLLPSAEQATNCQFVLGESVSFQLDPEFVEV